MCSIKLSMNLNKQIISKNASNRFCSIDFHNKSKVKFWFNIIIYLRIYLTDHMLDKSTVGIQKPPVN